LGTHIECGRPDVGCYPGLVCLAGVALVSDSSGWLMIAAFLAPALVSTGAYYAGAYFDRDLDAVAKPDRPVPSGRLSVRSTLIAMVTCTVAGLALSRVLSSFTLVLALVVVTNGSPLWDLVFAALIFWQQDSMLHQVLAIEDTEVDRHAGVQTLPARYGHMAALLLLVVTFVFWFGSVAFQPASIQSRPFGAAAYAPFAALGAVLAIAVRPAARACGLLALGRPCIAAGFVAAAGDVVLGLALLVVCLAVTWLALPAAPVAVSQGLPDVAVEPAE
jgi:geranylgeranylglycerol-phosphate geranylgeranyltransferase